MRWVEFDFEDRLWRIPTDRMKMRSPHVVPLAKQAISILTGLREYTGNGRLVFPCTRKTEDS
jgi:integrase